VNLVCANKKCRKPFLRKASNQIYCSSDCCKIVTNENIKEKYRLDKERKAGKKRICKYCPTRLSKYNPDVYCISCSGKYTEDKRQELKKILCH